jgi:hypothetical protein
MFAEPFLAGIKFPACSEVMVIEMATLSFACSWAVTTGNFSSLNAHRVPAVTDFGHKIS